MNTATATQSLEALATRAAAYDPSYTGAGEPVRKATKIVNSHHVTVKIIGWDARIEVELDRSTEALNVFAAAEQIAA